MNAAIGWRAVFAAGLIAGAVLLTAGCTRGVKRDEVGDCRYPATAVALEKTDIDVTGPTIKEIVTGKVDIKTEPQVQKLVSDAAADSELIDYMVCRSADKGETRCAQQYSHLRTFLQFMAVKPTADQVAKFVADHPFPECPQAATYTCDEEKIATGTYDQDLRVRCRKVVFEKGAVVTLVNGRAMTIEADIIVGNGATVSTRGADGARGADAAARSDFWEAPTNDYWNAVKDPNGCKHNRRADGVGADGSAGATGGAAGDLCVTAPIDGAFTFESNGGKGGDGGKGGGGRLLKNSDQNYCDGCMTHCLSGRVGDSGVAGARGHLRVGKCEA